MASRKIEDCSQTLNTYIYIYIYISAWVWVRDWSLITGRGGGYKTEGGGHVKFYPYEKGGAEKVLAMLKGGHKKF